MGLVEVPRAVGTPSLFGRILRIGSTNSKDGATSTSHSENDQLQQQLTRANEQLTQSHSDVYQFQREVEEKIQLNTRLQQQLTHANDLT